VPKPSVPSAEESAKKWGDETPKRSGYYEKNASKAGAAWESGASGAAKAFKGAVQATDIDKRFQGGIKKAGAGKYERKVKDVGVARFGPGVSAAVGDMQSGVAPYLAEIGNTEIPERGPRGDAGNYKRVENIGNALHKKRIASLAAGA